MPKACTMPGAIANTALTRGSCTSSAGAASSGSSLRKYSGTIGLLRQPRWKARYFSGLTRAPPTQSAVKPPCEWPATPIRPASIEQRVGNRRAARGRKFPYETRHIVLAHVPVLTSIGREGKPAHRGGPRRERRGVLLAGPSGFSRARLLTR